MWTCLYCAIVTGFRVKGLLIKMGCNLFINRLILSSQRHTKFQSSKLFTTKSTDEPEIPVNPLKKYFSANEQKNGQVYQSKPFKMECVEGKVYHWCLCGRSKQQPICDGSHKNPYHKTSLRPIRFTVTKTKEYWLCNCKQTSNRPFCDGSHKEIKEKTY